jgi:hypothetical protein
MSIAQSLGNLIIPGEIRRENGFRAKLSKSAKHGHLNAFNLVELWETGTFCFFI